MIVFWRPGPMRPHEGGRWIYASDYDALEARCRELEAALLGLYSGTVEYVYLNHLGDPHNTTPMRNAAKALGAPALEAYDRLRALTAKETQGECKFLPDQMDPGICQKCGCIRQSHVNRGVAK